MSVGIITLGHGGGVPLGRAGNTNFALVPGLDAAELARVRSDKQALCSALEDPDEHTALDILSRYPYWLVDCGPETVLWLCGCLPGTPEPRKLVSPVIQNLLGVLITHAHTDHSGGLAALAWRCMFIEKVRPQLLYHGGLHTFLAAQLTELRYANAAHARALGVPAGEHLKVSHYFETPLDPKVTTGPALRDPVRFELRDRKRRAFATGEFIPVDHNIDKFPAYGVGLYAPKSGRTVLFSGDTARPVSLQMADPNGRDSRMFVECRGRLGVSLLYQDTQFYNDGDGTEVHCPYRRVAEAFPEAYRPRVMLAHTVQEPTAEARAAGFGWAGRWDIQIL